MDVRLLILLTGVFIACAHCQGGDLLLLQRRDRHILEGRSLKSNDWSYQGDTKPSFWGANYPACDGPFQSPIDLPTGDVLTAGYRVPLQLSGYDVLPDAQILEHDGWSVELHGSYLVPPTMRLDSMGEPFTLRQVHFHWGENDNAGSEHTIDGKSSPLEIHFVHQSASGSLAVLGVLTYIDNNKPRDDVLFGFWSCFAKIEKYGDECKLTETNRIKIRQLLPSNMNMFYRYIGSTTTPPCLSNVTWTVFKDKVPVSSSGLSLLRTMRGKDDQLLLRNYRPTQGTDGREILLVSQ